MPHFAELNGDAGIPEVVAADSERLQPMMTLVQTFMRGESELSIIERELLSAYVSQLNNCVFCQRAHEAIAVAFGGDVKAFDNPNEKLKPVVDLARKLTMHPAEVRQADIDAMTRVGWSARTVQDVITITSIYSALNRMANGYGVSVKTEYYTKIGKLFGPGGHYPG